MAYTNQEAIAFIASTQKQIAQCAADDPEMESLARVFKTFRVALRHRYALKHPSPKLLTTFVKVGDEAQRLLATVCRESWRDIIGWEQFERPQNFSQVVAALLEVAIAEFKIAQKKEEQHGSIQDRTRLPNGAKDSAVSPQTDETHLRRQGVPASRH